MTGMRTRNEYIHLLRSQEAVLRQDYGIRSLRLFGSVAREQQIIAYNMLKQIETAILRVEQRELQPLLAGVRFLIRYLEE